LVLLLAWASVRRAWVLLPALEHLALVSLTLASTSPARLAMLAYLATVAARSTALAPADWSASNLDRQLWDQKAAIAYSKIIWQLWVATRPSSRRIHRRKAVSDVSLPGKSFITEC
jgi:hypothetical protein